MSETRLLILGGGPAGVGAAWQLARQKKAQVVLLERGAHFGGNSGSWEWEEGGHRLDFGSHRFHPATAPEILEDVRSFLGDELLDRPRHGRIRLLGRWIHFPLKPVDLLLRLPPRFAMGTLRDMASKRLPGAGTNGAVERDSFATVLRASLGRTICEHFYFPYAVKLWGHPPEALSAIQAKKRVGANSFGKLVKKVFSSVPGFKPPGAGRFYYPRRAFGQISEAYAEAARAEGADLRLGWTVNGLVREGDVWRVSAEKDGERQQFEADHVWSTIPVTTIAKGIRPEAPAEVRAAADAIDYRAMVLIYMELPVGQFTEFDAHYFPGADTTITRLSENKNYMASEQPAGRTVLCAELPCMRGDDVWNQTDEEFGELLAADLERSGLPLPAQPTRVRTQRLPQAYPIYLDGYEVPFNKLDSWVETLPGFVSFGRQGLFAHDNTHHALFMAYRAAECLADGRFDREAWTRWRDVFRTHVVED